MPEGQSLFRRTVVLLRLILAATPSALKSSTGQSAARIDGLRQSLLALHRGASPGYI